MGATEVMFPEKREVFIPYVLVPEVARQLIHEDFQVIIDFTPEDARRVLDESNAYGRAMFPVTDDTDIFLDAKILKSIANPAVLKKVALENEWAQNMFSKDGIELGFDLWCEEYGHDL